MNCLCCGKELEDGKSLNGWHKRCVKRFFNTDLLPEIDINDKILTSLAQEATDKGFTVPGVQKKLSLHLLSDGETPRLTLVNYPTGYILKPQVAEYEALPEMEHLIMSMADLIGIATVPHALIKGADGYAYISKRVDRIFDKTDVTLLAMEDFCQLDLRLTEDKYHSSYERCARIITEYSSRVGIDMTEFFIRLLFCFVVGNSDMHLKNFSLIEDKSDLKNYILSPAYDLLSVNAVMPQDKEEFALTICGKKANIRRSDFITFAGYCGITKATAEKLIKKVISKKPEMIAMCHEALLPERLKRRVTEIIEKRTSILLTA